MSDKTSIQAPAGGRKTAREGKFMKAGAKLPARSPGAAANARPGLSPEKRRQLIAETAYFIAERRGFAAGSELEDWLQAEAEVRRLLGEAGPG